MKKNNIKNIIITLTALLTISCNGQVNSKKQEIVSKTEAKNNTIYKEDNFKKDSNYNPLDIRKLNITYKNYLFKLRLIEDLTFIQCNIDNKVIQDWKQIFYNFSYNSSVEDAENEIKLLYNPENAEGLLLLPGYTEEYPNLIVYKFDKAGIYFVNNLAIKDSDVNKLSFEEIVKIWSKDSFSAKKTGEEFSLTLTDNTKKTVINFTKSENHKSLSDKDTKAYINKILVNEKETKFDNINTDKASSSNIDIREDKLIVPNSPKQSKIDRKYHGEFSINIETEGTTTGMASISYIFKISEEKIVLETVTYHEPIRCNGEYKAIEKEDYLELFYNDNEKQCNSGKSAFKLKKEGNKFFMKGLGGEGTLNKWIEIKKK